MDHMSDFRIERLSDVIEVLNIDRRTYYLLKRAEMHHVSSVIARGEAHIRNLKNIGPVIAERVCWAIAEHLNIPRERLFSGEVLSSALSCEGMPFNPLNAPITILDLPLPTFKSLHSIGAFVISDLLRIKAEANDYYQIGDLQGTEIRKVYTELNVYLSQHNQLAVERKTAKVTIIPTAIDLGIVLAATVKDERTLRIIELRANQLLTLEEIATEAGGVTRERIRQIIDQVHEKVGKNLHQLKVFCDFFEARTESIGKDLNGKNFAIDVLVKQCKLQLPDQGLSATEEELKILIAIIRLLTIHNKVWSQEFVYERWKNFVFLACFASPSIKGHRAVNKTLIDNKIKNKKLSYKELALLILSKEKRPMHWSEIVDHAYPMKQRDSFNSAALYNAVSEHPDLFVRVDAGTYALVKWGFSQVDYYPDIIASILKSSNKPLSADAVFHKVNEIRQVKRTTLIMLLDLHPRFYRSLEKTYGLRAWLPSRDKQTLRTPEWLVEDSESYKRLEQASQRGYDIESMLQSDLDNMN